MLKPPIAPMEALSVDAIPDGPEWQYEPKWDGFRCLVFRDGDKVALQSKSGKPLTRYFPDIVERRAGAQGKALRARRRDRRAARRRVLVRRPAAAHPSGGEPRIEKLARETPALLIVFDLLADERGKSLLDVPLQRTRDRSSKLSREQNFAQDGRPPLARDDEARRRRKAGSRKSDRRSTASSPSGATCHTAPARATRMHEDQELSQRRLRGRRLPLRTNRSSVGSLLLGLYDDDGLLHHVGFTSSIARSDKPALTAKLEKLNGRPASPAMRRAGRAAGRPNAPPNG